MANVENLTQENVTELQKVFSEIKGVNPDMHWNFYDQDEITEPDSPDLQSRITILEEKIDTLIKKIDFIFGDEVLINGRFVNSTTGKY